MSDIRDEVAMALEDQFSRGVLLDDADELLAALAARGLTVVREGELTDPLREALTSLDGGLREAGMMGLEDVTITYRAAQLLRAAVGGALAKDARLTRQPEGQ